MKTIKHVIKKIPLYLIIGSIILACIPVNAFSRTLDDIINDSTSSNTSPSSSQGSSLSEQEFEDGKDAINKYREQIKEEREASEKPTPKPEVVDPTRWNIKEGEERTTQRNIYIGAGTTKLEVFYSTGSEPPAINFISPSGNIYYSNQDVSYENTIFVTRKSKVMKEHSDVSFYVIYFSGLTTEDIGRWTMEVFLPETVNEFFIIAAQESQNWETLNSEYKTVPKDTVLWYLNDKSQYQTNETIQDLIKADDIIPMENKIKEAVPEEVIRTTPIQRFLKLLIFLVPIVVIGLILFFKKLDDDKKKYTKNKILNDNQRLKLRKQKENAQLDKIAEYANKKLDYSDAFNIEERASIVSRKNVFVDKRSEEEKEREKLEASLPSFVDESFITETLNTKFNLNSDHELNDDFDLSGDDVEKTDLDATSSEEDIEDFNNSVIQESIGISEETKTASWMQLDNDENDDNYF